MFRRLIGLAFIGIFVAFVAGCDDDALNTDNGTHTFKNRSSFNITITPNGQNTWSGFVIGPGQDRKVEVDEDGGSIYFMYSPSNKVRPENSGGTITFYNR